MRGWVIMMVLLTAGVARADAVRLSTWGDRWLATEFDRPSAMFLGVSESTSPPDLFNISLPMLFDDRGYTVADAGRTFTATAATDTDFATFVAALTDGVSDILWTGSKGSGGQGVREPQYIWGDEFDPRVDLHGYTIQSFSLVFNDLRTVGDYTQLEGWFYANTVEPVAGRPPDVNPNVVPLPTAAVAGAGLLGGLGVVRMLRLRALRRAA